MSVYPQRKRTGVPDDGLLYSATGTRTISNTAAETTQFPSSYVGSLTLPAGWWEAGKALRIDLRGLLNVTGTPNATMKIKLQGVDLVTSTGAIPVGVGTDAQTLFDFCLTCRTVGASGQFIGEGQTHLLAGVGIVTANHRALRMTAPATLNTTLPMTLDVTYQFDTASASNNLNILCANVKYWEP